jgi:hypothetical protein
VVQPIKMTVADYVVRDCSHVFSEVEAQIRTMALLCARSHFFLTFHSWYIWPRFFFSSNLLAQKRGKREVFKYLHFFSKIFLTPRRTERDKMKQTE